MSNPELRPSSAPPISPTALDSDVQNQLHQHQLNQNLFNNQVLQMHHSFSNLHHTPSSTEMNTTNFSLKQSEIRDLSSNTEINDVPIQNNSTCPYGCCTTPYISNYLFVNGLLKGEHYDVIIEAFGKKYKLHKLFLDKSPYFKSLFSWSKSTLNNNINGLNSDDETEDEEEDLKSDYRKVYRLQFDMDENTEDMIYTKRKSFELAISRLYGVANLVEEYKISYNMIEIGQYLAIPEIVCTATDFIVKNMDINNLAENLRFAITSNYGSASQRIIENGKGILCSNGWENGPEKWDRIPTTVISEVVGEDYFFVPTEWDRCIFIIKLIERRQEQLKSSKKNTSIYDDVEPIKKVLNAKVHYCNISPLQLQELEEMNDINGNPYIEPQVLHSALWQTVQLETLVSRSQDLLHLDSLILSPQPPSNNTKWFKVPTKDETLSGLPKELDELLDQSLSKTLHNQLNADDAKSTQADDLTNSNNNLLNMKKASEVLYNWTKINPFRFSVSFANVSELSTDKRVYGKTFWYAGSYWNLYLQKSHITSKNSYQIGVYLHRAHNGISNSQSKSGMINSDVFADNINYKSMPKKYPRKDSLSSFPTTTTTTSIPYNRTNTQLDSSIDNLEMNMIDLSISDDMLSPSITNSPQQRLSHSSPNLDIPNLSSLRTRSRSPSKSPNKYKSAHQDRRYNNNSNSIMHYEDERSAIKVYFIIFTPSRRSKPTITSFLSVPNDFSKSQSWGWKSNNMCVFNEDGTFATGQDPNLKFMILLGNI